MLVDWFRRRTKFFIWIVIFTFIGSLFFLAAGTMYFGRKAEEQQAKQDAAQRKAEAKRQKGDLDPTDQTELARVKLGTKERGVTAGELNELVNNYVHQKRGNLPPGMDAQMVKVYMGGQALDQLVQTRLLDLAAEQEGIDVVEERRELKAQAERRREEEGVQVDPEEEAARIEQVLQQIKMQKILSRVTDGAPESEAKIQDYYNLNRGQPLMKDPKNGTVKPLAEVKSQIVSILRSAVSDGDIKAYYEAHKDRWRNPDRIAVEHLMVDPEGARYAQKLKASDAEIQAYYDEHSKDKELQTDARVHLAHIFVDPAGERYTKKASIAGDAVKKYYDAHKSDFVQPERAGVRRILLKVAYDAKADEIARLDDKAQGLLKSIKAGKKFEDVAQESSEDLVTAKKGGDLGLVDKGTLSAELEHVVFSLKAGEMSEVVKDDEGFQIVKVYSREPEKTRSLDDVKADITKKLNDEAAQELAQKDAEAIATKAASGGIDFGKLAREQSQAVSKDKGGDLGILYLGENKKNPAVDEVGSYGYPDSAVQEAARKLKDGEVSGVVKSAKGLHILKVMQHLPSETRPLAEAREEIALKVREEKRDKIGRDATDDIRRRLIQGEPFAKLVTELSDGKDKAQGGLWNGVIVSAEEKQTLPKELIGEVAIGDLLPDPVVTALKGLAPGQVSDPAPVAHKLHLFHERERLPATYRALDDTIKKKIQFALNPTVTDDEAQSYFAEHKSEFEKKSDAKYQYVIVGDEDAANDMCKRFAKDPKEFDRAEGKEEHEGFIKNPDLRAAFDGLAPGEIHKKPVKTTFGYVIGKVVNPPAQAEPTYKGVADEVKSKLLQQHKEELFNEWMGELRNQAIITRRMPGAAATT